MTIQTGLPIGEGDFINLPVGSKLTDGYRTATVLDNGYAVDLANYNIWPVFNLVSWRVVEVGTGEWEQMTVEAFKQKVRTVCIGAAREHSVRVEPVFVALRTIGIDDSPGPIGVGMHVHRHDAALTAALARHRHYTLGIGNPNRWEFYGEFDRHNNHRMGGVGVPSRTLKVIDVADPDTDIYLREPTEEDAAEVARLRGRIWEIGARAKTEERWCAAYETAVGILGVSPLSVTQVTAQPGTSPESTPTGDAPTYLRTGSGASLEQFGLGAVFEYGGTQHQPPNYEGSLWNWTRKVEGFRYQTRNYIGPNSGHQGGMNRVLWDGHGQMGIPIHRGMMRWLPPGTRLATARSDADFYEKDNSAVWRFQGEGVGASDDDFFIAGEVTSATWRIVHLPDTWESSVAREV